MYQWRKEALKYDPIEPNASDGLHFVNQQCCPFSCNDNIKIFQQTLPGLLIDRDKDSSKMNSWGSRRKGMKLSKRGANVKS